MTYFQLGFMTKMAEAAGGPAPFKQDNSPAYASRATYTGGVNTRAQFANLARSAAMCSSGFNVLNGMSKNVRTPKPEDTPQQQEPQK